MLKNINFLFIRDKLRLFIIFLIMCLAFSIPFGHEYGRKLIVVIFVLWFFVVKIDDIKYVFKNKFVLTLLAFILMHYISIFWSENYVEGLYYIRRMWMYLFAPIFLFVSIIKKNDIPYIINSFIAGMFVNEIISYLIYFDLYQTEFSKIHRYPVGFLNHITYSVLVAFSAILILFQARNIKNKYLKSIYILFFITMTINLVISSGRTGYIVYFVSLIILLFAYYKFTYKNFLQLLIFPTIVFYIGYKYDSGVQARVQASLNAFEKIENSRNYDTSFGTRLAFYPISYDILNQDKNSFIFGVGTGDIYNEMKSSIKRTKIINSNQPHLHNSYLSAYVNAGISALILLLLLFYYLLKSKIMSFEIKFIQYLFIINFTTAILSDVLLNIAPTMFYFSLFSAIIIGQEKIEHNI